MNQSDPTTGQQPANEPAPIPTPTQPQPPRVYPDPPTYHWDFWAKDALERGLDRDLVILGRAVIRETDQHAWSGLAARFAEEHVVERLLRRAPEQAKRLYELLLDTDGLRIAWVEEENSCDIIELPGFYC